MMIKVGITGGIGSGKTTVCKIFETLGIPIYYADHRAKELMVKNNEIIHKITILFGSDAYLESGALNRKLISHQVFKNKQLLSQLNNIVHPIVFQDTQNWFQLHLDKPYSLYEAAIMFESGSYTMMNKMITVFAPMEDRITRVMNRDNMSREDVLERINQQMPEEEKINKADFVIYNNHTISLIEQVLNIHHQLISLKR